MLTASRLCLCPYPVSYFFKWTTFSTIGILKARTEATNKFRASFDPFNGPNQRKLPTFWKLLVQLCPFICTGLIFFISYFSFFSFSFHIFPQMKFADIPRPHIPVYVHHLWFGLARPDTSGCARRTSGSSATTSPWKRSCSFLTTNSRRTRQALQHAAPPPLSLWKNIASSKCGVFFLLVVEGK